MAATQQTMSSGLFGGCDEGINRILRQNSTLVNTILYRVLRYTKYSTRFCQTVFGASNCNHHIAASIQALLTPRQPITILRGIAEIIISSFDSIPFWHWPHISQKILKLPPTEAKCNAAASIIGVCRNVWIGASTNYVVPTGIFWATFSDSIVAMCLTSITTIAPTAFCAAVNQMIKLDYFFFSTIAAAFIKNSPQRRTASIFKNKQPRVSNPDFANMNRHSLNIPCGVFLCQRKLRYG